jgi:aminodeoxyfutalosine deaminase
MHASVVPHAPYSVSPGLFEMIGNLEDRQSSMISIHNQECQAENRFFRSGDGPVLDHLKNTLGLDTSHWKPSGRNSLESVFHHISGKNRLLLVHNTYTDRHDVEQLKKSGIINKVYLVLCPGANLYIENRLPPVKLFCDEGLNLCLGTDSPASNPELSLLHEMFIIQENFPWAGLHDLLTWACLNGAMALNLDDTFGTIEKGKKPGLILISGIDWPAMKLTSNSKVLRLV